MPGSEDMVHAMEKILGLGEVPPGSNHNYVTDWYGLNGPWCDMTISYAAAHSGNAAVVGRFAYTVAHAQWFNSQGQWHTDVDGIRRGDVVFFDWGFSNSIGAIDHVGLVTGTASGGAVLTIEGNTADVCARRVRYAATIVGYGRPAYVAADNPTPAPAPAPAPAYQGYPGAAFFTDGKSSPIIGRMHDRLVAEDCNRYQTGVNRNVWGSGDVASYKAWQGRCGFTGDAANGIPGVVSWNRLKVPKG